MSHHVQRLRSHFDFGRRVVAEIVSVDAHGFTPPDDMPSV